MSLGDPRKSRRLIEGFRGLPRGMDGSKDPILVPEGAAYYAQNVTFRGGDGHGDPSDCQGAERRRHLRA